MLTDPMIIFNLFNIQYIYLKFCNYGNIMAINKLPILNV